MIPKKLYIPTSTLNFNNIMSSESISPAAFYANRRFGYKRFEKVDPNNLDNLILLYDKYPIFDINDKESENYPLVIEIDTRSVSEDCIQEKDGIFYTTKSVYINPFSTRIIFRNEPERATSLSNAERSIESKLIPLYRGQLVVLSSDIETFDWFPTKFDDLLDYDNIAVSFDIAVNKLKGMLYGYLLGANSSYSKEVVSLKRKTKELRNVLSAVIVSPDGYPTPFQKQQLDNLYTEINQIFYALSGVNEIIAQKIKFYKAPNFVEILQGEGFYQEWFQKQVSRSKFHYYQINPFYLSSKAIDKVAELDKYINNIETNISTYDAKIKLDVSKLPIVQNRTIIEIPDQKRTLSVLFCKYMDEVWNGNEFLSSRYDFANVGGKIFREIIGSDKWENSTARTYINTLRKNLNEYTEFDINSISSDTLKSFAAFCQKGDKDIDKLRDYLISNGICDFRIAFALWGLIFGFAEMPKTLTNELFESQDEQYISDCYKYIHKQLHSIELAGALDRRLKNEEKPNSVWQGMKNIGKKVEDLFGGKSKEQAQVSDSQIVRNKSDHKFTTIPEELKIVYDSEAFKKLSLSVQDYFKKESLALYQGRIDKPYIEALKKIEYPYSKTGWKTNWKDAIKTLTQKQKNESKRDSSLQTLSLFAHTSTGEFLKDYDYLQCNEEFKRLVSAIKDWEKDLKWFIDSHNPLHEDYKYYEGKPTDNESVIKQFIFLKKEKYKNTEDFLRKTYLK